MKISLLSLAALVGVAAGFSAAPLATNVRSSSVISTELQLSSTQVDADPFAKGPRWVESEESCAYMN